MPDKLGPAPLGFMDRWRRKLAEAKVTKPHRRSPKPELPEIASMDDYGFVTKSPVKRLVEGEWLSHGDLRRMQRQSAKAAKNRGR